MMKREAEEGEIRREPTLRIKGWSGTVRELAESGDNIIDEVVKYVNSIKAVRKLIPYYGEFAKYGPCCRILTRMYAAAGCVIEKRMLTNLQEMYAEVLMRSYEGRGVIMVAMGPTSNYTKMQKAIIELLERIKSNNIHLLRPLVKKLSDYVYDRTQPERRNAIIRAVISRACDLVRDEELYTLVIGHLIESYGEEFYYMVGRLMEIRQGNCPELLVLMASEDRAIASNAYHVLRNVLIGMRKTWISYHKQVVDVIRPYVKGVYGLEELL